MMFFIKFNILSFVFFFEVPFNLVNKAPIEFRLFPIFISIDEGKGKKG